MANAHHQPRDRRGASTRNHNEKRRTAITLLPSVPPAQQRLLQSAQQPDLIPAVDPETMSAKQGLNEWGAFTGGSDSGTFGLGSLLFRHVSADESQTTIMTSPSPPLTGRDLVEMDRLLRNDPVSFNPMQAISWAKMDEDVTEEPQPMQRDEKGKGKPKSAEVSSRGDHAGKQGGRGSVSSVSVTGKTCHTDRDEHSAYNTANIPSGTPLNTSRPRDVYQRSSDNVEPTLSSVGYMAQTLSGMDMAGSDGYSAFVPPAAMPPPKATQRAGFAQPQVRQQGKHRRRHEDKADQSLADVYTQQHPSYAPSSFPTSSTPVALATQHPYPVQEHVTYTTYPTASLSNHVFQQPPRPAQYQAIGPFLCLAPLCQASFHSDAQLNAHYQAVHAASQSTHGGHQPSYSSPASLACSWTSCGAGGFTSENALMWHFKAEHLLLCPVPGCCDRQFPSRKQLDGHVRNRVG